MRQFETGATRDTDAGKIDFEGFLSPLALEAFGEYMNKNRVQADGNLRDSDNWQKGIPKEAYMKSAWRHFFSVWKHYREEQDYTEDLCALLFNVQGLLHETLKEKNENIRAEKAAHRIIPTLEDGFYVVEGSGETEHNR